MTTSPEIKELAAKLLGLEQKRQQGTLAPEEAARRQELLNELVSRLHRAPGAERRQHVRIPASIEARFRLGDAAITCGASELSYGGIGLRGHLWIIEDQELLVENLRVGERDYPMAVRAKVVWRVSEEDRQPGAGLAFLDVDEDGRRQIGAVYERLFLVYLERLSRAGSATG
jgi:hypothetical protein